MGRKPRCMDNFQPFKQRGRWWEPLSSIGSKKSLMFMVRQLNKYKAEYCFRQMSGTRVQLAIPKDEFDRIDRESAKESTSKKGRATKYVPMVKREKFLK